MSGPFAGWLQAGLLVLALAVSYRPLGDYMAKILITPKHWRAERGLYKVMGVNADADQKWSTYLRSVLAFSAVSVLFLYGFERVQHSLLQSLGFTKVPP